MNFISSLKSGPWADTIDEDCLLNTFTVLAGLRSLDICLFFYSSFDFNVIVFESNSDEILGLVALGGRLTLSPIFLLLINYFNYLWLWVCYL
jgi:hypothetical protein